MCHMKVWALLIETNPGMYSNHFKAIGQMVTGKNNILKVYLEKHNINVKGENNGQIFLAPIAKFQCSALPNLLPIPNLLV